MVVLRIVPDEHFIDSAIAKAIMFFKKLEWQMVY